MCVCACVIISLVPRLSNLLRGDAGAGKRAWYPL